MNLYEELNKIMESNPDLVFDNDGYQRLPDAIVEANKDAIERIEILMKKHDKDFVSFQNFKPRSDGSIAMRYQAIWNYHPYFIGVVYTPMEDFKPKKEEVAA